MPGFLSSICLVLCVSAALVAADFGLNSQGEPCVRLVEVLGTRGAKNSRWLSNTCPESVIAQIICTGKGNFAVPIPLYGNARAPAACQELGTGDVTLGAIASSSAGLPSMSSLKDPLHCFLETQIGHINTCRETLSLTYNCFSGGDRAPVTKTTDVSPWDMKSKSFVNSVAYDCESVTTWLFVKAASRS